MLRNSAQVFTDGHHALLRQMNSHIGEREFEVIRLFRRYFSVLYNIAKLLKEIQTNIQFLLVNLGIFFSLLIRIGLALQQQPGYTRSNNDADSSSRQVTALFRNRYPRNLQQMRSAEQQNEKDAADNKKESGG